jgi:hypothetical protein
MIVDRSPLLDANGDTGALAYIASVVVLQAFFRILTRWESRLAIVVSTLAITVLLNPPRRRIQSFIDRRFQQRILERRSRT